MTESTLVVTMGGQAQVVTFALDWLLAQGESIGEVVVLHLSPEDERTRQALAQLAAEFSGDRYRHASRSSQGEQRCRLRLVPMRRGSPRPLGSAQEKLTDIRDEADAEATWQTVYHLLSSLKAQGRSPGSPGSLRSLHLCIAGGRRMMGLLALSAAMLLCGHDDRVWHMYTPAEFLERARDGAIMHARPEDGVRLIQVPIVPWGAYFPALRDLTRPPAQIIAAQTAHLDEAERARCRAVVACLTRRQRDVLHSFASGLPPQEAAEALGISLKTVDSHKTAILGECRVAWSLPDEAWLDYHFLHDKFGPLLDELFPV
jgi:CRISPR-associated protein Csx14